MTVGAHIERNRLDPRNRAEVLPHFRVPHRSVVGDTLSKVLHIRREVHKKPNVSLSIHLSHQPNQQLLGNESRVSINLLSLECRQVLDTKGPGFRPDPRTSEILPEAAAHSRSR